MSAARRRGSPTALTLCSAKPSRSPPRTRTERCSSGALLAVAHETTDGRHKSALLLLARLVGNADGRMTLGPPGASKRSELFPTGWKEMAHSWPRLRYAWREGLEDLLSPPESEQATVLALDEITRIHPAEKEPVPVTIQEVFPSPVVSFIVSAAGLALSMRLMFRTGNLEAAGGAEVIDGCSSEIGTAGRSPRTSDAQGEPRRRSDQAERPWVLLVLETCPRADLSPDHAEAHGVVLQSTRWAVERAARKKNPRVQRPWPGTCGEARLAVGGRLPSPAAAGQAPQRRSAERVGSR